jgi:hypothetical protein
VLLPAESRVVSCVVTGWPSALVARGNLVQMTRSVITAASSSGPSGDAMAMAPRM